MNYMYIAKNDSVCQIDWNKRITDDNNKEMLFLNILQYVLHG